MFMDEKLGLFGQAGKLNLFVLSESDVLQPILTGPNVYASLMEEDSKTASLRERLKGELDKLSSAMESINSLEGSPNLSVTVLDSDDNMEDGVL